MTTIPNWSLGSGTGTTITCTLGFTPTAGKILLCCVGWDKSASSFTTPTGFTALGQAIGASVSGAMFYKVATGSETSVAVTAGAAPTGGGNVWVGEIDAATLVDSTNPTYSDTAVSSISTGTATGDGFAVAMMTVDSVSAIDNGPPYGTWSNSFTGHPDGAFGSVFRDSGGGTGQAPVAIAYKDVTGSASTTFTQQVGETADQMWAAVAIFAAATTSFTAYARTAQAYASAPGKT